MRARDRLNMAELATFENRAVRAESNKVGCASRPTETPSSLGRFRTSDATGNRAGIARVAASSRLGRSISGDGEFRGRRCSICEHELFERVRQILG
jgi:hypothetical protein